MRKRIHIYILFFLLAVPLFLLVYKAISFGKWVSAGLIYKNAVILGVNVGGMTKEEAEAVLMSSYQPFLDTKSIRFINDGREIARLFYLEVSAGYDFTNPVEAAWQYGRTKGKIIETLAGKTVEIDQPPNYVYNNKAVDDFIVVLSNKTAAEPVNASLVYENGRINIAKGKTGRSLDTKTAMAQAHQLISRQASGDVPLRFIDVAPAFSSTDLSSMTVSRLGGFETICNSESDAPRTSNIRIAAERINNVNLYPGEIFSTSAYINSGVSGSGYAKAIVLVNGKQSEDVGGGVCQVVTTLYNAILYAELPVVERHNHSARVAYADYGFDATVAGNYYDLKFKNNTSFPVLIVSAIKNDRLEVSLYGHDNRPAGRSLVFKSELIETIPPKKNDTPGKAQSLEDAKEKYKYDLYKYVYEGGQLKNKEKVNTSVYKGASVNP